MDNASSYLKILITKQNEIVLGIYPTIYSLYLYPELKEDAFQLAMTPCRMKAKQYKDSQEEVKKKVI
jgi:hypothetical protein